MTMAQFRLVIAQYFTIMMFFIASAAVFVVLFLTDFLIHGLLLKGQYEATAQLWRPEQDMKAYFPWMLAGQAVIALAFTRLFAHGYQNKGIQEGICFGFMMSVFLAGHHFIMYSVAPWPLSLVWSWFGAGLVQSMILGAVAAKTYKK